MPAPSQPARPAWDMPTRQQLDELEALMQRMLALPVHPTEQVPEEMPPEPALTRSPSPVVASIMRVHTVVAPPPATRIAEVAHSGMRVAETPTPPAIIEPKPASLSASSRASVRLVPLAMRPRYSPWLWPLLGCNRAFDLATCWLGPGSRWLRSRRGRALLGWTGILLLAGAASWLAVDGMSCIW